MAYNKGLVGTNYDLSDSTWEAFLKSEDEKKKIGFTGMGPKLDEFQAAYGPVDFTYGLDDDAWKAELDYPITDNIRYVGKTVQSLDIGK